MANLKSSKKRIRSDQRKRLRNSRVKSAVRTQMKKVLQLINMKNLELARQEFNKAVSLLDSAAMKGILKKNTASRHKSRLAKKLNALAIRG